MRTVYSEVIKPQKIIVTGDTQYVFFLSGKEKGDYDQVSSADLEPVFELVFSKSGVRAEVLVIYHLRPDSGLAFSTIVRHLATDTSCSVKIGGVLAEGSTSKYTGKIIIDKLARRTSSYLSDRVLSLGNAVRNHSEPILEIKADDVKASHEASLGKVDRKQVYYLMSRGLSRNEAENTIVSGFLNSFLTEIHDLSLAEKIRTKLLNMS